MTLKAKKLYVTHPVSTTGKSTRRLPGFLPFKLELGKPPHITAEAAPLTPQERLFNRDLSWLHFNERVLSEAADPTVPPLDRLRFATIVSSNLDEFFMIRVALLARRHPGYRFPDGLTAAQSLAQIRTQVLLQKSRQALVLDEIVKALKARKIEITTDFTEDTALDEEIQEKLPTLTICLRKSSEPLPRLPGERIQIFVRFPGQYGIIGIEEREGRFVELSTVHHVRRFALAERWLAARAGRIFPDRKVIEAFPFKIIRDAAIRYHPDEEETIEEQIRGAVERRESARVVRLEVDAPTYSEGALFLATGLRLDSAGLYRFDLPLDLRTLALLYHHKGVEELRHPSATAKIPAPFQKPRTIFETIRRKDILLHHPYDSFDIVLKFIEAAAVDEAVTGISHTMYRTSRESPVVAALEEAARRGKKVTVYVEIKARFDEANNLRCAESLRRAGVKVVRPLGRHKVHSKLTHVLRKEGDAEISYLHLGTGNYHPVTAQQYTDLGLLTCDAALGQEIGVYISTLSRVLRPASFKELMVAPRGLHDQVLRLIDAETRAGAKGRIIAKMNSLVDPTAIEALYKASSAGVKVDLLVRGICCLLPGIKGLSENIRVVSVIDRFLEHSRIYYFYAGGAEKIFLSSADWMPRNFYERYEIAFPIKDPALKGYIRDVILAKGLADNVKAWGLRSDGSYAKVPRPEGAPEVRSQMLFEALAQGNYQGTPLAGRKKKE